MTAQTGGIDPQRLFSEAQSAVASGNGHAALRLLDRLPAAFSTDANVLHLRALALKSLGRGDEARSAFEKAQRAAPDDPQIANNHANLLMQAGTPAAAVPLYDRAIALNPAYREARLNRALALQAMELLPDALAAIEALIADGMADARTLSAHGGLLIALGRQDDAAEAFDASLATGQHLPKALHGRARVALERGEADAVMRYRAVRAAAPDDRDALVGLADALEAEGDPAGLTLMAEAVERQPDWIDGLERLARMRAEAGADDFTSHYASALASVANRGPIRLSLAKMLAGADRFDDAIAAIAELGDDPSLSVTRAFYLGEGGKPAAGLALLDGLDGPEAALIEGRLALALGDMDRSAAALDRARMLAPESVSAWAHSDLLWRATGDDRALWLSGQDGLVAARGIGLSGDEIATLTELLRRLHRTRAHPLGQSLRSGTQTRGRLLLRQEPEVRRLRDALQSAVEDHVDALPGADARHPLLRHRNRDFTIAGSWSVRLTMHGFHVAHIHPEGVFSSACYFALPLGVDGSADRSGWLEVGRPPPALNLALEPLATIQPAPGKLVLFPSYLYHGTRPFGEGERLSVAFDVIAL